ncbi:Uncharacterised protein [Tatumella ptyseos]|uniref:Uncharacterized protein n=1 Tax=Tatumella ptyseos TaxID=82987 RepID=A0A2X5SL04_9GAMM|nr:Uncharacterised protein [Tatumella ptyseos]
MKKRLEITASEKCAPTVNSVDSFSCHCKYPRIVMQPRTFLHSAQNINTLPQLKLLPGP